MRWNWEGKDYDFVYVGDRKWCEYTTLQGAFDAISPTASLPVAVIVSDGRHTTGNTCAYLTKSNVTVMAESKWGASIRKDPEDQQFQKFGVISIAPSAPTGNIENVRLIGLRLHAQHFGSSFPDPALFIGGENNGFGKYSRGGQPFDNILVENCVIEGSKNAVVVHGTHNIETAEPGRVTLRNNVFRSRRVGLEIGGNMKFLAQGNTTYVDTTDDSPWDWVDAGAIEYRAMGYMFDASWPNVYDEDEGDPDTPFFVDPNVHANSRFTLMNERVRVVNGDGILEGTGNGAKQYFTGMGVYAPNTPPHTEPDAVGAHVPAIYIIEPDIVVHWNHDYTPLREVSGISSILQDAPTGDNGVGYSVLVNVQGGRVDVRQSNTGGSAPSDVYGVACRGGLAAGLSFNQVWMRDTHVQVTNAAGGGNAYAAATFNDKDRVYHRMISQQGTTKPLGIIQQLTLVP